MARQKCYDFGGDTPVRGLRWTRCVEVPAVGRTGKGRTMGRILSVSIVAAAVAIAALPERAEACGGFFCGQQPVDQSAERIIFAVGEGEVTMITQIQYQGAAPDFAWVLPLPAVPDKDSLETFPDLAIRALDVNTGPQFQLPDDCQLFVADAAGQANSGAEGARDDVTVHIRETVGPFDVAVIESTNPMKLVEWLRTNQFRVTAPMEPYIALYTNEGMKFLALRLQPGNDVNDIQPFKFTMPGQAPGIPLRMTALAAEPEMGILVFVLGDQRYEPKNWPDVQVPDDEIKFDPWTFQTNWTSLVAKKVDDAGGQGFVTEMAGATAPYIERIQNSPARDEDQMAAQQALLALLEGYPYLTRMYTRLSAEEMSSDPTFGRSGKGDVDRLRELSRFVDGEDLCGDGGSAPPEDATTPCDFTTCGSGGLCREAMNQDGQVDAACACVPGATARTTFDPQGRPTVICQDQRMSFQNPGDKETPDATALPDPCVGFDCGPGGRCVPMNMTPTCECNPGLVAVGWLEDGARRTACTSPMDPVPEQFYSLRLPDLEPSMQPGRDVVVPEPPPGTPAGGGCAVAATPSTSASGMAWLLLLAGVVAVRRRRR